MRTPELCPSNHQRHILFARQIGLLALPQRVVYRERVDRNGEVFGVHLGETFRTRVVSRREERENNR